MGHAKSLLHESSLLKTYLYLKMPRFKHHRSSKGSQPSVRIPAIISPDEVNNVFAIEDLVENHVNRMEVIAEDDMPDAFVVNDELFHRSRLYVVAKPIAEAMKCMIMDSIATSVDVSGIPDRSLK